jgi:Spy/CpxP family protein refolding chaperone
MYLYMKLRSLLKSVSALALAVFASAQLQAQTEPQKPARPVQPQNVEARQQAGEDEMTRELNLTEEQKAAFKKANDEYRAKSKDLKADQREEMQKLRAERSKAHKAALNAEQAKKYDEIMAKREARKAEQQAGKQGNKNSGKPAKKQGGKGRSGQ